MQKKLMIALCFLTIAVCSANELLLSENGKTDYQIVISGSSPKNVWDGQFLAWFLKEKTGADFPVVGAKVMNPKKPAIYLGNSSGLRKIVGETPYKGMKDQDHIVRSVGKDIVLYGKGFDADFYAVNEFLDRCLGFRFYQRFEVPEIVKTPVLRLKPFDWKLSWKLTYRELPQPQFSDYFRGENVNTLARIHEYSKFPNIPQTFSFRDGGVAIQPEQLNIRTAHTEFLYIPTASHSVKGYPFIENRDYFKTNPEFYSMKGGKRVPEFLCYSNKAMRKEFIRNIEKHFESLGTDNVSISVSMSDGVDVCHCPECEKLAKKYGTPGAAYFEFLLELGEEFMKIHPRTTIRAFFYQRGQTQIPPDFDVEKKFSPNIQLMYCDIVSKTNKTWDAHPDNRQAFKWLKKAAKLTDNIPVFSYYAHYGPIMFLPFASTNVVVDNLRQIAKLGLKGNFFEFYPYNSGFNWQKIHFMNFADLNLYLFYRFSKDPTLDYDAEVKDFCEHVYGPAAKIAKAYHDDLVRVSSIENKYGIILAADNYNKELSYLSPENLYKWEKMFDEMTKLTAGSKALYAKNVADLRRAVDLAVYGRWAEVNQKYPDYFKDHELIRKRIGEPANSVWGKTAKDYLNMAELRIRFMGNEKPLPAQFTGIPADKIKRVIPTNYANCPQMSKVPKIVNDKDAAFGYGATVDTPNLPFHFGYYDFSTKKHGPQATLEEWDINPGEYQLHKLGEVQPSAGKNLIWFGQSWSTSYDLSKIFDFTDVQAKYDVWVSLKFPKGYKGGRDEVVLCDQIILVRK